MSRETAHDKAQRLLTSNRLIVTRLVSGEVGALCQGDSGQTYRLGHTAGDGWWCSCAAGRRCSHLTALKLVVVRTRVASTARPTT